LLHNNNNNNNNTSICKAHNVSIRAKSEAPAVVDPHTQCRLFADDCLLYRVIDNIEDQLQLQKDLAALEAWAADWGMQFNASKCHVMSISRQVSQHLHYMYYQLCEVVLDTVLHEQYLGFLLSYDMSWSNHIHTIAMKAHQKLGFLHRNLKGSPLDCKKLAYVALVHSALEYASII